MIRKILLSSLILVFLCSLAVGIIAGVALIRADARPIPAEGKQALFRGIVYVREVHQTPRSMVVHSVRVDLRTPGISFLVTPGDPEEDMPLTAQTTTQFLDEFGIQLAVNGDSFEPFRSNSPLDYYPHAGDPVDVTGLAASNGTVYSEPRDGHPVLYLSRNNRARINTPIGKVYNAISGTLMLVKKGKSIVEEDSDPEPRTALALDRRRRQLIIVVVDGRQPGYSEGATLAELAEIMISHGGYEAINLDGGGSTTLVMEGDNGQPVLLNAPIDHSIPGHERPVANHLGIYAERLENN